MIGWASGWSMVLVAAWTNERLAHFGRPALSAAVFAGPGAGIFISGMLAVAINGMALSAAQAWLVYGVLALVLVGAISMNLPRTGDLHRPDTAPEPLVLTPALKRLVWSYSLAGFGYILPATFLSQMAAARFPGSLFAQFVWPIFGGAAVLGIVIGILTRHKLTTQSRLAITLWIQALGVLCAELVPGVIGLVLGALFTGGGFLSVVQLSILHGRELAPHHARYMAGLLTTGYALGQLVGPMLSAVSTALTQRLEPALYVAVVALAIAGLLVINTPARAMIKNGPNPD
uniref:Uncharacterized protein n=1 Tax=Anopheles maculatus TaxID=74869 RepID=A0A182T1A7_9DIPT